MLLSSTHLLVLSGSCSFRAYPFNRSVVSSFQVSSHFVKFNSFHLQAECCPNYIILIPSLSCFNRVLCPFAQVLFALSSLASLFNRSVVWIFSSLFLFSNGVFSTSFISIVFFSQKDLTSQGSLVSLVGQRSNLVLPLLLIFHFPSGAILDLGTRSSRSGGVL